MQSTYGNFLGQGGQTLEWNGIYKNCTVEAQLYLWASIIRVGIQIKLEKEKISF